VVDKSTRLGRAASKSDGFMIRRTAVKKRRTKPRRGRVIDKPFLAWMHAQPCAVRTMAWLCSGEIEFHHVRDFGSPKNDRRGLPLCTGHHTAGETAIHKLGKRTFQEVHGIDIEGMIATYNRDYESERAA
jgi:hypothetical protein